MPRYRCLYCPHDAEVGQPRVARPLSFEYDSATGECPRCGRFSGLELVAIHFVVLGSGKIFHREMGRSHIACQPERDHMAKSEVDMFSATGDPRLVTCPDCRRHPTWLQMAKALAATDKIFARKMALLGVNL